MLEQLRRSHTFFLAGFGCEYSLQPLARYLEEDGFKVIAADMQDGPLPPVPTGSSVFITSQHPARSSFIFRHYYGQLPPFSNYVGPLEIIQRLQPSCSVFVPHDLESPIVVDELTYMAAFDLYCAPFPDTNPGLRHSCQIVPAGWIKHNHFDDLPPQVKDQVATKGVFFLNQVSRLIQEGGAAFVQANYPQLLAAGIPIKLPSWPGCHLMGEELRQSGANILAQDLPSTKLIAASSRLYINASGSVVAEARYVGTETVLVEAGSGHFRTLVPGSEGEKNPKFDFRGLLLSIANHIERNT